MGKLGGFRGGLAGVKKIVVACGGGELFRKLGLYAYPAGAYFCSYKSRQNTLGALPQDPCRWLCWIRIDFRREPKINPYCAQNRSQGSRSASALSPHPLSRGGKGARMGGQVGTESDALGVLGFVGSRAADPWLWLAGLAVCRKGRAFPSPEAGEAGRGQMRCGTL